MKAKYGRSPLHLLGHLAALAFVGWALLQAFEMSRFAYFVAWMIGAVLLHDALLWPLYSVMDRVVRTADGLATGHGRRLSALNHVRVPVGMWLVLGLVYLPVILERGEGNFTRVSGQTWDGHLGRWLLTGAVLFAASAILYGIRVARASRTWSTPSSRPVT